MVLIEPHEIDDDLQVGIKSIEYYLNLEIIRQNFVMFMKPCQEKFREARKRLSHLVGTNGTYSKTKRISREAFHYSWRTNSRSGLSARMLQDLERQISNK